MKQVKLHPGFQLAVLRIGVAITVLIKVFAEFSDLDMLFSQHGIIQDILSRPLQISYSLSLPAVIDLFHIQNEHLFLSYLYILFGIGAFSLLIGFKSRLSALICLLIHMMVFNGYNLIAFGFDGFLFSLLFYTLMFPVGKVYAVDVLMGGKGNNIDPKELNLYLKIMQVHLCIVYLTAGVSKYGGQEWMDGTAIWKAINQPQFYTYFTPYIKSLASNTSVCAALTWGTLFAEIFFSLLIWVKWGKVRVIMLLSIILMHVFIGVVMGLQLFAWIMIVFDLSAFAGVLLREKVKQQDSGSKWKALEDHYSQPLYL
jgi:hypothetical protein